MKKMFFALSVATYLAVAFHSNVFANSINESADFQSISENGDMLLTVKMERLKRKVVMK